VSVGCGFPLLALLEQKKFRFWAKRPVFDLHHFTLSGENSGKDTVELRVLDHQLQLAVTAEAEFFPQ